MDIEFIGFIGFVEFVGFIGSQQTRQTLAQTLAQTGFNSLIPYNKQTRQGGPGLPALRLLASSKH